MMRERLRFFDQHSEALERRIATGLHKIGLALKHQTWLQAAAKGLSPTQGQILGALATDGPLTGSELARRIGVALPTISDSARVLVEKRLVTKAPDQRHPRASLLALTPAGRRRATSARAWPEFLATAAGTLSEPEQAAFLAGLVKMIRALQEREQIPVSRMCATCVYFRPLVHQGPKPHHCTFVDAPMADSHLRLDCREHEEAPRAQREEAWSRFMRADAPSSPSRRMRAARAWGARTQVSLCPTKGEER